MEALGELLKRELLPRQISESNDSNVGSARQEGTKNATISGLVSALTINLVVFAVLVLLFCVLRRTNSRIYDPRTFVGVVERWRRLRR